MSSLDVTYHARLRAAQRNIPLSRVDLLMLIGTEVENGYFIRHDDCDHLERILRDVLKQLPKWRGARLIVQNGAVLTTYKPTQKQERSLLRETEEHSH